MSFLRRLLAGASLSWAPAPRRVLSDPLTVTDILMDLNTSPGDIAHLSQISATIVVPDRIPDWMLIPDTVPVEWL